MNKDEALEQPEPEPVVTLEKLEQEIYENTRRFVDRDVMEWMLKRYYTAPPKREWQGLTEEEKGWCAAPTMRETIKRVEAKLEEKNT